MHNATLVGCVFKVHAVWKVREESIQIRVCQGESGKVREFFSKGLESQIKPEKL